MPYGPDNEDPLAAARGIYNGVKYGLMLWAIIGFGLWLVFR